MDGAKTTRRHTTEEGEDEISSKGLPARVQSDPEDSSPSTSKPAIVFRDAVDRKFKWPFDRCQKWKNVANLISEACSHIDAIGEHVNEGRYDLFDPEGYLILPSVWEDTIQPGWEISMRIWPIEDVTSANPPSPSACSDFSHSDKNEDDKFGPFMFPLDVAPLGKKRKKSKKSEATVQMRTQAVVRKRSKQALAPAKPPGGDIDTSDRIPMIEYGVDSMAPGDRQRLSPPHPLSPQIAMAQFERGVPQTPTFEQDQDRPKYDLAPILPPSPFHKAINAPFIDSNRQGVDELLPITVEPDLPLPHKRGKQNEAKNAEVEWAPILLERGRRTRTDATIGVVLPPEPLELAESVNEGENSADDSKGKLIWKMQRAMAAVLDKIGLGGAWSPGSLNMFSRIRSKLASALPPIGYHHLCSCINIIGIVLISLLFSGCTSGSLISGIYVMSLQYQSPSRISSFGTLDPNLPSVSANASSSSQLQIRSGYFSICTSFSGASWRCQRRAAELSRHLDVNQDPLNLVDIAKEFENSVIFPGLFILAATFAALSTLGLSTFPGWRTEIDDSTGSEIDIKPFPNRLVTHGCFVCNAAAALLSLLASLRQHTAAVSVSSLIETTGYGNVKIGIGACAMALGWVGFFLFALTSIAVLILILSIRMLDRLADDGSKKDYPFR